MPPAEPSVAASPSLVAAHPDVEPLLDARAGAQRARLLEGMAQAVAEKGYAAATVADAVRLARVSRGTFYALFASKEACFLESYRHGVDVLVDRVAPPSAPRTATGSRACAPGLRAYLRTLAGEPRFARTHLLEVHAAGPARAGRARRRAVALRRALPVLVRGRAGGARRRRGCPPTTPSSSSRPASTSSSARSCASRTPPPWPVSRTGC